ncbi:PucR family transcriptional regulator [Arthrobacter sp. S2(2024)]|uniref:PucR family transcriptional regulator n=1 Tax=Arthrobacter sp. S2(2024) TaxID=3111911 RepID=UPI002FCA52FD
MAPTLAQVLSFEPFTNANATLISGEGKLEGFVSWVHCSEMKNVARLFYGGELLLTQGRGISRNADEQRAWVDELHAAGIAGVGIETGVLWPEVPTAVAERARQRGLPVIALRHPAYFMAMTQAVHSAIVNSHYDALKRADELTSRLSRLALAGGNIQSMLDELASMISHPVVLTDRSQQVEAVAPQTQHSLSIISGWPAHSRHGHEYHQAQEAPRSATSGGLACTYRSIVYKGELWGCIHVLNAGPLHELALLSLERAVIAIGLSFAIAEGERRHDDGAQSALIQDLLGSGVYDPDDALARAKVFGADLSAQLRVVMVQLLDRFASRGEPVASNGRLRAALGTVARAVEHVVGANSLVGYSGTRVVAICPAGRDFWSLETLSAGSGIGILSGISTDITLKDLSRAGAEASEAVHYALQIGRQEGLFFAGDLGIERLLLKLDEGPTLIDHIERELGPVLDYDASSSAALMPTLVSFLTHSGNKSEVAKSLHIERRTLYHRLDRLRALLGPDIEEPDRMLALQIAVRGLGLRQRQRDSSPRYTQ